MLSKVELCLNIRKNVAMQFSISNLVSAPFVLQKSQFDNVSSNRDLRITVNVNLSWSDHYNKICSYDSLRLIKHTLTSSIFILQLATIEAMSGKGYEQSSESAKESHNQAQHASACVLI